MKRKFSRSYESEMALVITDRAKEIAKSIASLTSIGEYDLGPKNATIINDTYFDTIQGSLRKRRITLRIRRANHTTFLSMKSDPKRIISTGTRRREIEIPWSRVSLNNLFQESELEPLGFHLAKFPERSPAEVMTSLGLEIIQQRITKRETKMIFSPNQSRRKAIAELAIDRVTYFLENTSVQLNEIEIEAKAPRVLKNIRIVADALMSLYPERLREWIHGKFVTGLAIRRLMKNNGLSKMLMGEMLKPEAFNVIDQTIRSARF